MSMVVRYFFILSLVMTGFFAMAQEKDSLRYQNDEIMGMVSLYKYMLNTVGSDATPTSEKETIISTSYLKIFRDKEVQIEDDLLESRSVILNKSVEAYLRDIDFFFKSVRFSFAEISLDSALSENGEPFYKISMTVNLQATDLNDSIINRTYDRFLEINETESEGLKIVSVYTTEQHMDEQLLDWWVQMDTSWQNFLADQIEVDSIGTDELREIVNLDSLDLSNQSQFFNLTPLTELRRLTSLNLSNTQVLDLLPIRYASNLQSLDISYTLVSDLDMLSYLKNLSHLKVKGCQLLQEGFLSGVDGLTTLDISETTLTTFSELSSLTDLEDLDVSFTSLNDPGLFADLTALKSLNFSNTSLQEIRLEQPLPLLFELDASNTFISDLSFVEQLPALRLLNIEYTKVGDLKVVVNHPSLEKVFADFSEVETSQVNAIMSLDKDLIILTETDQVIAWWNELPEVWRNSLQRKKQWRQMPSIEDLVVYLQTDSLDLSREILHDSKYLSRFRQLRYLDISNTYIEDLSFVEDLNRLQFLDISFGLVTDIEPVLSARSLISLDLSGTSVSSLGMLGTLPSLKQVSADDTQVPENSLDEFAIANRDVLLIYRTKELQIWWDNLNPAIKRQLAPQLGKYSVENLHRLVLTRSLDLKNFELRDFDDLEVFRFLRSLTISQMTEQILPDLSSFAELDSLSWERAPVISLAPVQQLRNLKYLSVANTAVEDLKDLSSMQLLQGLDCSGTQIKSLKSIRDLKELKFLNISNTRVWQLNWLYDIRGIETLLCYNTRVSNRQLEQYRVKFPHCTITNY